MKYYDSTGVRLYVGDMVEVSDTSIAAAVDWGKPRPFEGYSDISGYKYMADCSWKYCYKVNRSIEPDYHAPVVIDAVVEQFLKDEGVLESFRSNITVGVAYVSSIDTAFTWSKTEQGEDYWEALNTKFYKELNTYREREKAHMPLPDDVVNWKHKYHYLHWSIEGGENTGKVAFTPTLEHGKRDRQIVMKLGKYLRKYYPELDDVEVRDAVGALTAQAGNYELILCRTREEIIMAYEHDHWDSCMARGSSYSESRDFKHPTIVYESPDVAVGLVKGLGRVVLNMIQRTYCSIYGDKSRMIPILNAAGYEQSGDGLLGCTLKWVVDDECDGVLPYLDGVQSVSLCVDDELQRYWVVGEHVSPPQGHRVLDIFMAENTDGSYVDARPTCECCGDSYDEDDAVFVENTEERICTYCFENESRYQDVFVSGGGTQETWDVHCADEFIYEHEGDHYTSEGLDYHDLVVAYDGEVYPTDGVFFDDDTCEYHPNCDGTECWDVDDERTVLRYNIGDALELDEPYEGCFYLVGDADAIQELLDSLEGVSEAA